jgi:2-C-methyl-D-erythritol 4-phosphate cytidylyltransferase
VSTTEVGALDDEQPRAVGQIPTDGRGSLPFALLRGESLVAMAAWAAGEAGIDLLDFNADWEAVRWLDRPLMLHDPLCPLTPVDFLRQAVATTVSENVVVVGVHPVTDTVKRVDAGVVGETVDREGLWAVTSPVVLPASVVSALEGWPDADDLAALVARLRATWEVRFLEAPVLARRVEDVSSLRLLEALAAEPSAGATQA